MRMNAAFVVVAGLTALAVGCSTQHTTTPPVILPPVPQACPTLPAATTLYALVQNIDDAGAATYAVANYAIDAGVLGTAPQRSFTLPSGIDLIQGIAVGTFGAVYVGANTDTGAFYSGYCPDATGAATPFTSFVPDKLPAGGRLAVDGQENLYATAFELGDVDVFAPDAGSTANPSPAADPTRVITGADTGLFADVGMTVDAAGTVYVGNVSNITVYAPGATGDRPPIRTLDNPAGGLLAPTDVALDSAGNLYVLYEADNRVSTGKPTVPYGPPAVAVYPAGSSTPSRVISGPATQLGSYFGAAASSFLITSPLLMALAVDNSGTVYVASKGFGKSPTTNITNGVEIAIFGPAANGNVAPTRTIDAIAVTNAGFIPKAMAVDSSGNVYLAAGPVIVVGGGSAGPGLYVFNPAGGLLRYIHGGGLNTATGVAIQGAAENVVVQSLDDTVGVSALFVFPKAGGSGTPTKTIDDSALVQTFGANRIAIDGSGEVYLVSFSSFPFGAPQVFRISLSGTGAADSVIADGEVRFDQGTGIAVNAAGQAFVAALLSSKVYQYATGAAGAAVVPAASYSAYSPSTLDASGLVLDSGGQLFATSCDTNSFSVYAAGASTPSRSVIGPKTLLLCPGAVAVDTDGTTYVSDDNGLSVFAANASGNVAPLQRIPASRANVASAGGIFLDLALSKPVTPH
jgi:hypothetical protein